MASENKGKKKGGCLKAFLILLIVCVLLMAMGLGIFWFVFKKASEEMDEIRHNKTLVGQDCPDFEVTTTDGETMSLKGLLDGKEVLCIVAFATWCGPCEREFPGMDEVYQKYQDKFSMIGLDVDPLDDEGSAKEYKDSHGLTFPIAKVDQGNPIFDFMKATTYPTTLIIDRNGKVAMHRVGSISKEETFEKIVTTFMGDDYEEKQLAYYNFYAYVGKTPIPGVEFTVTSEKGTETYVTDEEGIAEVFTDKPEDLKIKVTKVPDGYHIDGNGEFSTGIGSTSFDLPVK